MVHVNPVFAYLSDDPQAYLLFLKDYIRPCVDICYNCKVRCLENFVKTASDSDLAWNRLAPDERPRPAHTLMDAQLADLGINSSNNYGLDLPEEAIDRVFQPAVRRLTLDINWRAVVEGFSAMTCCKMPDGVEGPRYQHDQYILGKKIMWMACPRFTAHELVRPRFTGDIMSTWIWHLAQLLSDGADAYFSITRPPPGMEDTCPNSSSSFFFTGADSNPCTCPIFSVLDGKHPNAYTGYEWVNLVLCAAEHRIDPVLLQAWSQPLTSEELLSSSTPYRPLCPGYDCQADRTWQEEHLHNGNHVIDTEHWSNAWFETSVNLIRLLNPVYEKENDSTYPPDSFEPAFLLPTGTSFHSSLITPQFREEYLEPHQCALPPSHFAHSFRQKLLKAYLARAFHLVPRYDAGNRDIPDLFVRSVFSSPNTSYASSSYPGYLDQAHNQQLSPMKTLFDSAIHSFYSVRSSILRVPFDLNKDGKVRPFKMPRCQRSFGNDLDEGWDWRPSARAEGWPECEWDRNKDGDRERRLRVAIDIEDKRLFWGCEQLMRGVFDWEGGRLGWEVEEEGEGEVQDVEMGGV